ncbi:MAG TPA: pilus assembly protein TadG-related protein [Bryobacteraceae bacterium]|nr:pilus assembly protein TadG-related protein [Bryobacteraceae bacterium]
MKTRRKRSGGQAIVMVTLALFAMAGMMGLAVDLGWSFFVQKQAQASADSAALSAVQEAITRLGGGAGLTGWSCASEGTGPSQVECQTATNYGCSNYTGTSTSNLSNGCQYATANGFTDALPQHVTIQSGDLTTDPLSGAAIPVTGTINRLVYWVQVRTAQSIPQLFSSILGNTTGTVSAVATGAIVATISPGSFYGMNRAGDCASSNAAGFVCGLDFQTGNGRGGGAGGSQACGPNAIPSDLCAPKGVILGSNCGVGSTTAQGCSQQEAGLEQGAGLVASSLTIMGANAIPGGPTTNGVVAGKGPTLNMSGGALTATNTNNLAEFQDPMAPNSQPPLMTSGANMPTCGIPDPTGTGGTISGGTLGPFVYYSYQMVKGLPVLTGAPVNISGNVNFNTATAASACTGLTVSGTPIATSGTTNASFPTYVFVGGLANSGTMTLAAGQYVMAGTSGTKVLTNNGTIDGTQGAAQTTGTMFIFTDAAYPGLNLTSNSGASAAGVNFSPLVNGNGIGNNGGTALNQGGVAIPNSGGVITQYGLVNGAVPALDAYTGIVWWQDRRNSTVGYTEAAGSAGCDLTCSTTTNPNSNVTGDNGAVFSCGIGCPEGSLPTAGSNTTALAGNVLWQVNHVTATSPGGVDFTNGNGKIALNGVYYQPRGAWTELGNGNTGFNCPATSGQCPLQLVTGAIIMANGTTRMVLAGPTNPIVTYKPTLIQ